MKIKPCVLVYRGGKGEGSRYVGPWVAAQVCHGVAVTAAGLGCLCKLCSSLEEGSVDPSCSSSG